MQIEVVAGDPLAMDTDALVVPVLEDRGRMPEVTAAIDRALGGAIRARMSAGDVKGKLGEVAVVAMGAGTRSGRGRAGGSSALRVIAAGVGKPAGLDAERIRRATGRAVRWLDDGRARHATFLLHLAAETGSSASLIRVAAEAAVLAGFRSPAFGEKGRTATGTLAEVRLATGGRSRPTPAARAAARAGQVVGESANLARRLAELPGNQLPPRLLAEAAIAVGKETGLEVTVHDEKWIRARSMGALLAVAQGSSEPPRFIVLEHVPRRRAEGRARATTTGRRRRRPHIALIGKGVTFDTGGISLKPREDMERMKYDMSGAAAVLGALRAASLLDLPLRVTGVIPTVENMPSGTAIKPGDVVISMAGKSIEITNTDAEGRLILADAIRFTSELQPDAMVDIATLTGACRIALGGGACGLMGNDVELVEALRRAGVESGELAWPLPLLDEYFDDLASEVADMKNSGGRSAGALTAGAFLKAFAGGQRWAHLDIAGTGWVEKDRDYLKCGSAGFGVRLFSRFLEASI